MESRTFYSKSRGLLICADPGKMIQMDGETKRVGEKRIEFRPVGDFGIFQTTDPELIAYLDKRIVDVGDVFGPAEYQKRIVPPEMRADALERELQDANRLIAQLKAQKK